MRDVVDDVDRFEVHVGSAASMLASSSRSMTMPSKRRTWVMITSTICCSLGQLVATLVEQVGGGAVP